MRVKSLVAYKRKMPLTAFVLKRHFCMPFSRVALAILRGRGFDHAMLSLHAGKAASANGARALMKFYDRAGENVSMSESSRVAC